MVRSYRGWFVMDCGFTNVLTFFIGLGVGVLAGFVFNLKEVLEDGK